jgi:hypothetical protein
VAVRFDGHLQAVRPDEMADSATDGALSAAALGYTPDEVTVFNPIPASTVQPSIESEAWLKWRFGSRSSHRAATSRDSAAGTR